MTTTTTDSFTLSTDREAAFWRAVQALVVDPQASALTLVRQVLTSGTGLSTRRPWEPRRS